MVTSFTSGRFSFSHFGLFERQVASIRQQTYTNWRCFVRDDESDPSAFKAVQAIIGGDSRFEVFRGSSRLGFYNNFERCLAFVPNDFDFVTLTDQDDYWYPDKLESLLAAFDAETTLVYSDMNLVSRTGMLIDHTFWSSRPNNYTDLASLMLQNCITGAASMFRRDLLDKILPFPPKIADMYHDHWIGCVALAAGRVRYIERPLYDYVQHGGNAIGHQSFSKRGGPRSYLRSIAGFAWTGISSSESRAALLREWQGFYFREVLPTQLFAQVLSKRVNHLRGGKSLAVRMLAHLDSSLSMAWLAVRGLSIIWRTPPSLGREYVLLRGILWLRLTRANRLPTH